MQQPIDPQTSAVVAPGQLAEDLYSVLGLLKRGWRYLAVCAVIGLTAAIIHTSKSKSSYLGSARLLVLQQGGRILPGSGGDPLQSMRGGDDSLATHVMIIRSPIIVERALDSAGLKGLAVESVVDRLTVTLPDATAKVLQVGYSASTGDEASRVIKGVIATYETF